MFDLVRSLGDEKRALRVCMFPLGYHVCID